jgi:hypothetical protein
MQQEAPPGRRLIKGIRWLYFASIVVGFPLWLLVAFVLMAWVRMALSPIPDVGPIEFQSPSATQMAVLCGAGIAFLLIYPAAFFWAYRITRHPWIVFAAMLVPVLAFCYAVAYFPITDSNAEERSWLTYLGSLAGILLAGSIVAAWSGRSYSVKTSPA